MSVTRRLTTVFYADVAGYSRLTGTDEVGTHHRVMAMLDDVTAQIGEAGGTVLRYAGDAVLATFPSVVLAVDTAAAIQTALADGNVDIATDERVAIRIGINLGDVIEDRGEVYGDGVNLGAGHCGNRHRGNTKGRSTREQAFHRGPGAQQHVG